MGTCRLSDSGHMQITLLMPHAARSHAGYMTKVTLKSHAGHMTQVTLEGVVSCLQ